MKFRYIAVEGPIGVGKSTLARQLSEHFQAELVLDPDEDNPFLPHFYQRPERLALHTQLHFLLARIERLEQLKRQWRDDSRVVADFMLAKDRIFAELALDESEWDLYARSAARLVDAELPQPDLVIYLQAPLPKLIERIERRGLKQEMRIRRPYLAKLIELYERYFHNYTASPLLIVNAAEINLVESRMDRKHLLERVAAIEGGRHYLNPGVATG